MSWSVGCNVGTSFAQWSAKPSDPSKSEIHRRWYLPKLSAEDGLRALLQQHSALEPIDLSITMQTAEWIVERRHGGPLAWLTTSGFESLPPCSESVLNSDLMFGVSERVRADGQVERPVALEELEFLVSKLQMSGVRSLAIGFLHAHVNPSNEQQAAQFLRERGFQVFTSHSHNTVANEQERRRLTILDAYVAPEVQGRWARFATLKDEFPNLRAVNIQEGVSPYLSQEIFLQALKQWTSPAAVTLHLGLEQFICIAHESELASARTLSVQPTQLITSSAEQTAAFDVKCAGYEPGPMAFGKSLVPTFVDLLYLLVESEKLAMFDGLVSDKLGKRVADAVGLLARQTKAQADAQVMAQDLLNLAVRQMAIEIGLMSQRRQVICTGALAPLLMPHLKKQLAQYRFTLGAEYAESLAVASYQPRQ